MTSPADRAPHRRWRLVLLVALGGAVGTAIRTVVAEALPPVRGIAGAILVVNVIGAFLLGVLLESLARRGPDVGGRRAARLLLGTGLLGGLTTYSTLAVDTTDLLVDGRVGAGVLYALLTLVAGLAAVVLGLVVAGRVHRGRADPGHTGSAEPDLPAERGGR